MLQNHGCFILTKHCRGLGITLLLGWEHGNRVLTTKKLSGGLIIAVCTILVMQSCSGFGGRCQFLIHSLSLFLPPLLRHFLRNEDKRECTLYHNRLRIHHPPEIPTPNLLIVLIIVCCLGNMEVFCKSLIIIHVVFIGASDALSFGRTRREALNSAVSSVIDASIAPSGWIAVPGVVSADDATSDVAPFTTYQIFPDASATLYPTLKPVQPQDLEEILSMTSANIVGGAVWLGEHHNSARDHKLQADFVRKIHNIRQKKLGTKNGNMSVGLEMVQVQFQPVLDAYIAKKISADEMKAQVQ